MPKIAPIVTVVARSPHRRGRAFAAAALVAAVGLSLVLFPHGVPVAEGSTEGAPAAVAEEPQTETIAALGGRGRTTAAVAPAPRASAPATSGTGKGGTGTSGTGTGAGGTGTGTGTPAPTAPPPVPGFGRFAVRVTDAQTGRPIPGACISIGTIECTIAIQRTDSSGNWSVDFPLSNRTTSWDMQVKMAGYTTVAQRVNLGATANVVVRVTLRRGR